MERKAVIATVLSAEELTSSRPIRLQGVGIPYAPYGGGADTVCGRHGSSSATGGAVGHHLFGGFNDLLYFLGANCRFATPARSVL